MTSQEYQWLDDLLQRLAAVRGVAKDPQADALIRERLAGQPDAIYLLVQRVLLLEQALESAKQQIAQLQQAQPSGASSFLGAAPGIDWGRAPAMPAQAAEPYPSERYAPGAPPTHAPTWRERLFGTPTAPAAAPSAGPSLLGSAASTAAGVAGGMFLFNGLENLLGGHRGGSGLFGTQPAAVENVTQNFFDDGAGNAGNDTSSMARDAGSDWDGFSDPNAGSLDDDGNSLI